MEELYEVNSSKLLIEDEIDNFQVRMDVNDETLYMTCDKGDIDDEFHESDEEQPVCKKSKHFVIESDEELVDEFHESDEDSLSARKPNIL